MTIKIDKEFEKIIPALTDEEFKQLEENCIKNGIQDSIKLWQGLIIDGHNRYKIAQQYNLKFNIKNMKFDSRENVIEWMLNNQLGRRNLNPDQLSIIRGKLYNLCKLDKSKNLENNNTNVPKGQKVLCNKTAQQLAEKYKVNEKTIRRDAEFVNNNPKEAEEVLQGKKKKRDVIKEKRKKETEKKIKESAKKTMPANIKLLEGDMFSLIDQIKNNSIDLLCTDPPYMILDKSWDMFKSKDDFMKFTEKWLNKVILKVKDTGRIYISFAQDYIFDLYNIFLKHNFYNFNFYGQIIWSKKNNNKIFSRKGYRISFEPILYLYGKNAKDLNFSEFGEIQSNVWEIATPQSNYNEGKFHPAQKPIELYRRIISTGSKENDLILDCFAGSGTTGIVCKKLKRNCILIEKDKNYIEIIKGRINNK